MKGHKRPKNCNNWTVPKTNESVWPSMKKKSQDVDVKLQKVQGIQLKGMFPLGRIFDMLLKASKAGTGLSHTDTKECLKLTKDSYQLMQTAFTEISFKRRYFIKADLKPCYRSICNDNNPIIKWLFGDNVDTKMKEIDVTQKLGNKLRKSEFSSCSGFYTNTKMRNYQGYQRGSNRFGPYQRQTQSYGNYKQTENHNSFLGRGKGPPEAGQGEEINVSDIHSLLFQIDLSNLRNTPLNFRRGKIKDHLEIWKLVTLDDWILDTVQGYKIGFESHPAQQHPQNRIKFSNEEQVLLDKEIQKLLEKNVITLVNHVLDEYVQTFF